MRSTVATVLMAAGLAACGTEPQGTTKYPYTEVPADPQRPGDPAKGYDYLVNGGYISCGIPKSTYDALSGPAPAADRIPGRTGDNETLAYSFSAATSSEGVRVVSANCLTCHAGRINGQLIVGLGASDADFTQSQLPLIDAVGGAITDPTEHAEWQRFDDRIHAIDAATRTRTIGVNAADTLTAVLASHRDPATLAWSATSSIAIPPDAAIPVDVPPWWRMAKKNAMFYTSAGRGDHARIEMAASLLCTDTVAEAQVIDQAFVDVRAWIETTAPPPWPFPVDAALAAQGKTIFEATCSQCHGTYGTTGVYPNELIPQVTVGTDPTLAVDTVGLTAQFTTWFQQSFWGQTSRFEPQLGYVAPPLDGIWATAPFFHNGSVPTIEAVLDSSQRPRYWTRTFDSTDYDTGAVGWKFTALTHGQADEPDAKARARIYDTTLPGYDNGGHLFGDALSAQERTAVIEYLKTL